MIVALLFVLSFVIWLLIFEMSLTGRAIEFEEERLLQEFTVPGQSPDFSTGLPSLSPSILPSDKLIQGLSEEELQCEDTRAVKRAFCSKFAEEYPDGCAWYAAFMRRCIVLRDLCFEAQEETQNICNTS